LETIYISLLAIALVILVAGGLAVAGLVSVITGRDDMSERLQIYAKVPEYSSLGSSDRRRTRFLRWRLRLNSTLSAFASDELGIKLTSANWQISEVEYLLIRVWATATTFILGWLIFRNPLPAIGLGIIAYLIPAVMLQSSIQKRRRKFEKQLVDVLVLITGAVRAGYSLLQSLDVVIQEMASPMNEEFRRVKREIGLGLPLSQALENLNMRMQNDDLYLVISAININSQVGGNLTTMLEAVTETIRERVRLFSEIRAVTAQQRYSAYMLTLVPFAFAGVLFIITPDYIMRLFDPGITLCFPIGAVICVILGNLAIMRLSKIDV
jgi:tight adherence protein B